MDTALRRVAFDIPAPVPKSTETFEPTELDGLLVAKYLDQYDQLETGVWYAPSAAVINVELIDYSLTEEILSASLQNEFWQAFEPILSEVVSSHSIKSWLTGWPTVPPSLWAEKQLGWIVTLWESDIQDLSTLYEFRSPSEVAAFLHENDFLISLLRDAHTQVEKYFGPDASMALEIFVDPEGDGRQKLFLCITRAVSPEKALELLTSLDKGWWLDAVARAEGLLTIQVNYSECSTGKST